MSTTTHTVVGMVCGHCADTVSDEVTEIDGVTAVSVDVDAGTLSITSDRELGPAEVRAAVEEAGYELA